MFLQIRLSWRDDWVKIIPLVRRGGWDVVLRVPKPL